MLHQFGGPKDPWLWNKIKTVTVHFFMINLCGWWMKVKLLVLVQDLLVRGTMCIIAPPTCTKMWERETLFSCTNTNMEVRTIFIVKSVSPHWDFSSNKKKLFLKDHLTRGLQRHSKHNTSPKSTLVSNPNTLRIGNNTNLQIMHLNAFSHVASHVAANKSNTFSHHNACIQVLPSRVWTNFTYLITSYLSLRESLVPHKSCNWND